MAPPHISTTSPHTAARLLAAGGIVALPSETVYGLGALATNDRALHRIYDVKGRPTSNPLIVHVRDSTAIDAWADSIPDYVPAMLASFWPGPLTVVLVDGGRASQVVRAGQSTIALRSPNHPLFQDVLRELEQTGIPAPGIAAPSANRYGKVSPTSAQDVIADIGERLRPGDGILDGGISTVGLESTILICKPDSAHIARLGAVSETDLAKFVPIASASPEVGNLPGTAASHYAPAARVHVCAGVGNAPPVADSARIGIIGLAAQIVDAPASWQRLTNVGSVEGLARNLYPALRRADRDQVTDVIAILPTGEGLAAAIRDRLARAACR